MNARKVKYHHNIYLEANYFGIAGPATGPSPKLVTDNVQGCIQNSPD